MSAIKPAIPAAINANSAVITHAPCRYTIRTLEPRDCSSGPNKDRRAITIIVMKNKVSGDLNRDIARFYLMACQCERPAKQSPIYWEIACHRHASQSSGRTAKRPRNDDILNL